MILIRKPILSIFVLSLLLKLIYFLSHSFITDSDINTIRSYHEMANKNDATWYQGIVDRGYPKIKSERDLGYLDSTGIKQSEWAFFPLYPMLNKGIMLITGLSYNSSAFILSLIFSFLSLIGFYYLSMAYFHSKQKALTATLVLVLFPFSFYFSMYYTEALFLTLLTFAFISIYHKKLILMSLCLIPLSLIRPNGMIMSLPLLIFYLEQEQVKFDMHFKLKTIFTKKHIRNSIFFALGPITFLIYCVYQYNLTGYFFAFSKAQSGWGRQLSFPWESFFSSGVVASQFNSIYALLIIILFVVGSKKLPFSYWVLAVISIILPLITGSAQSMTRFLIVIFPLFFIISSWISFDKLKWIIPVLFILHMLSFYLWIISHPLSY